MAYNHHDLPAKIGTYENDKGFSPIINELVKGKERDIFSIIEGFLLHGLKLCVTLDLRVKVLYESHALP